MVQGVGGGAWGDVVRRMGTQQQQGLHCLCISLILEKKAVNFVQAINGVLYDNNYIIGIIFENDVVGLIDTVEPQ